MFEIENSPLLSARVNFTSTESDFFKIEITVFCKLAFSTESITEPFMEEVCEKPINEVMQQSRSRKGFLMMAWFNNGKWLVEQTPFSKLDNAGG